MAIYKHTTETAKQKCIDTHGDLYDYSEMIYINSNTPFKVRCKIHGIFETRLGNHTGVLKRGCPKCSLKACDYTRTTKDKFIEKGKAKHGDKFDYSLVDYKNNATKVKIICPKHGVFEQLPANHYKYDCAQCSQELNTERLKNNENSFSKSGFKAQAKERICTMYLIKCWNETELFYKIGITTESTRRRFHSKKHMPYNFEILKEIFGEAEAIWTLENNLKQNLTSQYKPTIKFAGSVRECYSDIDEILKALP